MVRTNMRRSRLKEINTINKPSHDTQWRIGLVYPNSYTIGMSGLSVKLLYHLLNQHQNIYTERVFFSADLPGPPRSIETGKILKQFDLLAFTFQFELDYINAIRMLLRSNIPAKRNQRTSDHPILIAGGPAITANAQPLLDIVDIIFPGEFEPVSNEFLEAIISSKYYSLLESILTVPGFYSSQDPPAQIRPILTPNLDEVNYPSAQVRPISGWIKRKGTLDGYFLQISRGCDHGCHFCLIGKIFRPMRERSLETLKTLIDKGKTETNTTFFSLIGSSVADYSQINELLQFFLDRKLKFTLPSIRIDTGREVLDVIKLAGQKSLSIAPESASEEIRFSIGKKFSNSQVSSFVKKADKNQLREIKLYFILGLSNDPIFEAREIVSFISNLTTLSPSVKFSISVTPLITKRSTKLDYKCVNYRNIQLGFNFLKKNLSKGVRYKSFPAHWAAIQAILSTGGSELTSTMIEIAMKGGTFQSWKKTLTEEPSDYYLKHYCH